MDEAQDGGAHLDWLLEADWAAVLAYHSRQSFAGERPVHGSTMYMCMDGMDQAKFRVPRNTSQSKDLAGRQRPQIHCVGAIVDGLADFFYFNDFRVSKDANLQITLTARTLGVVADLLAGRPGVAMPQHLVLHSDNAAGEGKNQTVMKFCAWLVWRRDLRHGDHDPVPGGAHSQSAGPAVWPARCSGTGASPSSRCSDCQGVGEDGCRSAAATVALGPCCGLPPVADRGASASGAAFCGLALGPGGGAGPRVGRRGGEFRGAGEDNTPGAVNRLIGKRRRTSEPATPPAVAALAGDRVAALAVGSSGAAKAPPPPKAAVPAKVKAVPKAAKAPPPAVSKAKATAAKAAAPLCPGPPRGKCRFSPNGCRQCKRRNGWFEVSPGKWEHRL